MSQNIDPSPYPYRHSLDIQARFNDFDGFGHVNNTVYLQYMDLGKEKYISQVIGDIFHEHDDALVIVNINCDFCQVTAYSEPIEVLTRVDAIGKHTITFDQRVVNPASGQTKCHCRTVMVGYSPTIKETIEIPPRWRQAISAHESRTL